jgi:hypothetical protein
LPLKRTSVKASTTFIFSFITGLFFIGKRKVSEWLAGFIMAYYQRPYKQK